MEKPFTIVTESEILDAINFMLSDCTVTDLEEIAGYLLGGTFKWSDEENIENWGTEADKYIFEPNEKYGNAFGEILGEELED